MLYSVSDWLCSRMPKEKYPHTLPLKHGYACNDSTNFDEGITMLHLYNGCITVQVQMRIAALQ